jgi:hypothetical protein
MAAISIRIGITTPLERVDRQVKPRGALRMGCSTENQALLVLG